jgi:tRNA (cmo5U34)-methyltransferase
MSSASSLGHMPGDKWEFDEEVTAVFEDMLARSILQIDTMRDLVYAMASRLVQPRTDIVDLGCSRGDAMSRLLPQFSTTNRFIGVEVSVPMRAACQSRFADLIERGIVEIRNVDLRTGYPDVRASVTLSVLALMFIPVEQRLRVLEDAFQRTVPGGAFLLVEKLAGGDAQSDSIFLAMYNDHKKAMGYSQEAIDRKRLSLEGVLVPLTAFRNEQLLRDAGFHYVECFWRYLNFGAWVAIKAA